MNATSASRAESTAHAEPAAAGRKVLIWDAPVRLFHGLMIVSFAGAFLTAESERWRLAHVTLGYTVAGLVAFRIVWGLVGTRHARFSSFLRGPAAVAAYLRSVVGGRPLHHAGHNPAGALAIVALLGLAAVVTAAGWASYNETGGEWLKDLHEGAANVMLAVVGIHIAGVLVGSWLHRDNLIAAMVTGRKLGRPEDAVRSAWRSVAALMLVAVAGLWTLQWQSAPRAAAAAADAAAVSTAVSTAARPHTRDDD